MIIRTQEDFICKSNKIHNFKYDYSKVKYHRTNEKVEIICKIHGSFFMTPCHHLKGRGCKKCNETERFNKKLQEFKELGKKIHNNKYNYDESVYIGSNKKLKIICPVHGVFWQTPHCHIVLKQNCPICGHAQAGLKRLGNTNSSTEAARKKARETCMKRYGAPTWAESDEGREKLREIVTSDKVSEKMKNTCIKKYGAPMYSMSEEGKIRQKILMNDPEMKIKIEKGYREKYGSHYMQTDEGRTKAQSYIDDERRKKMRSVMMEKYGQPYAFLIPEVRAKTKITNLKRYGVPYTVQNKEIYRKILTTKRKNGTYNTSQPEEMLYVLLCNKYGEDNILRQYDKDERYPFYCDFYINTTDTFIELNAHWSHNSHWYDDTDEHDVRIAEKWLTCGTPYYKSAYNVWTQRDILKRDTAVKNKINYVVFWDSDLSDAKDWLSES